MAASGWRQAVKAKIVKLMKLAKMAADCAAELGAMRLKRNAGKAAACRRK